MNNETRFSQVQELEVYNLHGAARDVQLAIATCAGIINREYSRIYLIYRPDDLFWLQHSFSDIPQKESSARGVDILWNLLDSYTHKLQGWVVYDPTLPDTMNVATTLAGVYDAVIISPDLLPDVRERYQLPVLKDLRSFAWKDRYSAYHWAMSEVRGQCSAHFVAGMSPDIMGGLRSLLVATRTFTYWLDTRYQWPYLHSFSRSERLLAQQLYATYEAGQCIHLGWFRDEPSGVALTSRQAMAVLASDHCTNAEIWMAAHASPLPAQTPLPVEPRPQLDKIYVSFTISDGDNWQFCQHRLLHLWQDHARGQLPIGWTFSPLLVDIAPLQARYYLQTATAQDELIAGPTGAGYMYPSHWPDEHLSSFLQRTGRCMQSLGMTSLQVLDGDRIHVSGLPLTSRVSLSGMASNNHVREANWMRALAPYGVRGILSGTGLLTRPQGQWRYIAGHPLYQNVGLADTVDRTVWLIRQATKGKRRPNFVNVYVLAWTMTPSRLLEVVQRLGSEYEIVLPRTLLSFLPGRQAVSI